jgi:3-oxoacyl-[acyl-carrier protein] reductase
MIDLTGKVALVTGGSRGIGRACCLHFAQAGADVAIGYNSNHDAANSALAEIRSLGRTAIAVSGDIADRETLEALFENAGKTFGRVDIVVANAGIWKRGPIEELSEEEWRQTIDVNLTSVFRTCQLAAREMKPRKWGKIILISSTAGQRGEAYYSHYAASKGAIISFTKSLATELGPWNIHVNCVAPGWVTTDMSSEVLEDREEREKIERITPLRRIATPEDLAGPVLFLASSLSDQVQGEVLNVNGGSVLCG